MKRTFQASTTGTTSGLFVSSNGSQTITVVVYPKLWRTGSTHRSVQWPHNTNHLAISLPELDTMEIDASSEQLALLDRPVDRGGRCGGQPLLSPTPPINSVQGSVRRDAELSPELALLGIDTLMQHVGLGRVIDADPGLTGPYFQDPVLRPVLYRAFIDAVEGIVQSARRGFVWREDDTAAVRGRPEINSLVIHEATGHPVIRCTYQDFSRETPLLIAICTALTVVARDTTLAKGAWSVLGPLRERAILLRRMLSDVPDVAPPVATRLALQLQAVNRRRVWERALDLCVGVLWPRAGMALGAKDYAIELRVDTSRLWELIVLHVLRRRGIRAYDGNDPRHALPLALNRPWTGLGERPPRPDITALLRGEWMIADAKYKAQTQSAEMADLYQMFAYSHLAWLRADEQVESFWLVYPNAPGVARAPQGPYTRYGSSRARLWLRWLEFPSLRDAIKQWSTYLSRTAAHLETAMTTEHPGSSVDGVSATADPVQPSASGEARLLRQSRD